VNRYVDDFLITAGVVTTWALYAYFRPFADCGVCGGTGKKRSGKRFRNCWRCKGTGRRQVLGSKQVHRAVRSLTGYRNRNRRK
jgi:hypothetical protein